MFIVLPDYPVSLGMGAFISCKRYSCLHSVVMWRSVKWKITLGMPTSGKSKYFHIGPSFFGWSNCLVWFFQDKIYVVDLILHQETVDTIILSPIIFHASPMKITLYANSMCRVDTFNGFLLQSYVIINSRITKRT